MNKPRKSTTLQAFEREVKRLEKILVIAKKKGIVFIDSPIPKQPKRITQEKLNLISSLTATDIQSKGYTIDEETGELKQFIPKKKSRPRKPKTSSITGISTGSPIGTTIQKPKLTPEELHEVRVKAGKKAAETIKRKMAESPEYAKYIQEQRNKALRKAREAKTEKAKERKKPEEIKTPDSTKQPTQEPKQVEPETTTQVELEKTKEIDLSLLKQIPIEEPTQWDNILDKYNEWKKATGESPILEPQDEINVSALPPEMQQKISPYTYAFREWLKDTGYEASDVSEQPDLVLNYLEELINQPGINRATYENLMNLTGVMIDTIASENGITMTEARTRYAQMLTSLNPNLISLAEGVAYESNNEKLKQNAHALLTIVTLNTQTSTEEQLVDMLANEDRPPVIYRGRNSSWYDED